MSVEAPRSIGLSEVNVVGLRCVEMLMQCLNCAQLVVGSGVCRERLAIDGELLMICANDVLNKSGDKYRVVLRKSQGGGRRLFVVVVSRTG